MNKTLQYYENNANKLINKYDNAKTDELYSVFYKYIKKDDTVLDVGFGSGRDLNFIRKNITSNVFGLEGSKEFIKNIKKDDFFKNRISSSILPNIDVDELEVKKYDVIISIAVLMHLSKGDVALTIKNIKSILKPNGIVIISYTLKSRNNDGRLFYEISKKEMTKIFIQNSFKEADSIINKDSLGRDIEWVIQVYKLKG